MLVKWMLRLEQILDEKVTLLYLTANAGEAGKVLGWRAQIPDIEDIVFHAWKWHAYNNMSENFL